MIPTSTTLWRKAYEGAVVEVTMPRDAGKSMLFLDQPNGVSFEWAAREHRARQKGIKLMECDAGHLATQVAHDRTACFHLLRDWRRVT